MLSRYFIAAIAAFASVTYAWLPNDGSTTLLDKRGLTLFGANTYSSSGKRGLPGNSKIRGVNLGNLFVFEEWIDSQEWTAIGCGEQDTEFDCVMNTGQDRSDKAFKGHWEEYITEKDLDEIVDYGLNTIRVPLGYWLKEDLVDASEHFPRGGEEFVSNLCGWASDRGLYIILDLHGAPGAQQPNQPFTGQKAPSSGFYNEYNYGRAIEWLEWITKLVHTNATYRNVGMLEIVNEPQTWDNAVDSLRQSYYPDAYKAIRQVEKDEEVEPEKALHIQMMSSLWGSGNPIEFLDDKTNIAFDDHRYVKHDTSIEVSKESYIRASCNDDRSSDGGPTIVGEWSISVLDDVENDDEWKPQDNKEFYANWFAAQVHAYEKFTLGWVFWTWKASLGDDYRWSYRDAVNAGVIPKDLDSVASVC